jgi:hypothetical protein
MAKVKIYLSVKDGKLQYRDSEKHSGKSIKTKVKPGTRIVWTLDKKSGIADISGINIMGRCNFFSFGPAKKSCDKWIARVSKKAKGEIEYKMFVVEEKAKKKAMLKSAESTNEGPPPAIIIRI